MKNLILVIGLLLFATVVVAQGQKKPKGYFQKNRYAFQKARYAQTSKKYGKACDIFEKKRTRGEKKPLLSLGFRRKGKPKKVAEQN